MILNSSYVVCTQHFIPCLLIPCIISGQTQIKSDLFEGTHLIVKGNGQCISVCENCQEIHSGTKTNQMSEGGEEHEGIIKDYMSSSSTN